ncbi:response regulator transcription factor [Paenibacillus macquariensis]|uniref:response regulator transcription factor n=1 Tax=Paenibacillus macquariensis TaxID=948756 RepID=UPI002452F83C|nr:response regulator [Paenibacillus macquariensis]MEC0089702.1 response regulator [Paenibacillus macquariensis]
MVDDEPLARLALREYILLTSTDIEVVGEASNGEDAISFLQEHQDIDIILADIQMPRMNGVELLTAIRKISFSREPLIIMLSAYNDYAYVRDSFVLGAFDYMLKAKLDEAYIAPVLQKTVEELNRRQRDSASVPPQNEDEAVCSMLHRLAVSNSSDFTDYEKNENLKQGLNIVRKHVGEKNQELVLIRLSQTIQFEHTHRIISQTILTVLNKDKHVRNCFVCRHDDRHYILFFTFPEQRSMMAIRSLTHSILTDIKIRIRQFLNLNLSIGISDVANGFMQWNRLFLQAERLSALSYYNGYDYLFYPEAERPTIMQTEDWKEDWTLFKSELLHALKEDNKTLWKQRMQQGFELLVESFPSSPDRIRSALSDLIWKAGSLIYQKGKSSEKLHERFPYPVEYVRQLETLDETIQWIEQFLNMLHEELHQEIESATISLSPVVAKAKAILEQCYYEEIHLSNISEIVGVSESYLSKQFAKEIGMNFIPFLTNLRINKAKEGLENGLKIYDVAEKVGYVNTEHFSRIFKKVTGVSPLAYRKAYER